MSEGCSDGLPSSNREELGRSRSPVGPVAADLAWQDRLECRHERQKGIRLEFTIEINGQAHRLNLDPRRTLLDALRETIGLTGTKKGCDQGQCGSCTVLVDGVRVLSCFTLAATVTGKVTTIEGLTNEAAPLHPMQQAFLDCDAYQCGYCTPGQILSAIACVHEGHARTEHEIREYMSGNLCRCAAYPNIVRAVQQAAPQLLDQREAA